MTKELSKQLCELCGVEPKYYALMHDMDNELGWVRVNSEQYKTHINKYEFLIEYPDFGEPENFVKLLELRFGKGSESLMGLVQYMTVITTDRVVFLKKLNIILSNKFTKDRQLIKEIKQAIKNTEWEY